MTGTFKIALNGLTTVINHPGVQAATDPNVMRERLGILGRRYTRMVDQQFSAGVDPYGVAWVPSKKKSGKTLIDTTTMRRSFTFATEGNDTLRIGTSGPAGNYAGFHQTGTKKLPRRLMVPIAEQGLPPVWLDTARKVLLENGV